jgi:uncharacterized protein (TIGR02246 family)
MVGPDFERAGKLPRPLEAARLLRYLFVLSGGGLAAVSGCAKDRVDESAIRRVIEAQQASWNAGDVEGFMAGYAQRDDLVFTSGGKIRRGWKSTLNRYRQRYPDAEAMGKLEFSNVEITPTGPQSAVVLGRWQLSETERASGGIFTLVFVRHDGEWRIVHDHTSVASPPTKTPGGGSRE